MINARQYLEKILEAEERIKLKQEQIQHLHESLTSLSAPMDKEQVSKTKNVAVMSDTIARILDMEKEVDSQMERLLHIRQQAQRHFDMLAPQDTRLLTARYIQGESIQAMMSRFHYSRATTFRRLADATDHLQQLFEKLRLDETELRLFDTP